MTATMLHAAVLENGCVNFLTRHWSDIKKEHPEIKNRLDPHVKQRIKDYLKRYGRL